MPDRLNTPRLKYRYEIITLSDVDYKLFIKSDNPEVKMMGVLANFGETDIDAAIRTIIEGMKPLAESDFAERRYLKQLRVFMQLRTSIQQQFNKAMQSVSTFFKEENDFLYQRGEVKGQEKKSQSVIKNMIRKLGLTNEQAAEIAEVEIDFVMEVRASLNKKAK